MTSSHRAQETLPQGSDDRRPVILYIGAFDLPDGNPAAHRALANAKLLDIVGYRVILVSTKPLETHQSKQASWVEGVECWNVGSQKKFSNAYSVRPIIAVAERTQRLAALVIYNMPVLPSLGLMAYARKRHIKVIGDIADWYQPEGGLLRRAAKAVDTSTRMKLLNVQLDGLIVISRFLADFYDGRVPVLVLPPLVDGVDDKWQRHSKTQRGPLRLVYAGAPSRNKERLDLAIAAVQGVAPQIDVALDIVGITQGEFEKMYPEADPLAPDGIVTFHGRVPHLVALSHVKEADATLLIRDSSRLTKAGFPTKFVESLTCGVPVIATDSSDLIGHMAGGVNGIITDFHSLSSAIIEFDNQRRTGNLPAVNRGMFDYRNFVEKTRAFLEGLPA